MKTIGLLGGMSWKSTLWYYQALNEGIKKKLGGLHSAKIILHSVDFAVIEELQMKGDWTGAAKILAQAAIGVEKAGADFLLICTNTMHLVAPEIQREITIPLLHIADATAKNLIAQGIKKVGLLGTAFTMEQDFYKGRLENNHGLKVIIPNKEDRDIVHQVIYDELCLGQIKDNSKQQYLRIIQQLADQGAKGVILGCTEIGLLVKQEDTKVKLFDTTFIHADSAVEEALI
ncbi:MAG: aspartate/glutamate racemase family protein [Alcanivoracaceae bacterium]|nr:aspartate/glutamate racemase family protein [Alcanivoracaceae bacterium]